jgi:hypothetical protein
VRKKSTIRNGCWVRLKLLIVFFFCFIIFIKYQVFILSSVRVTKGDKDLLSTMSKDGKPKKYFSGKICIDVDPYRAVTEGDIRLVGKTQHFVCFEPSSLYSLFCIGLFFQNSHF